MPATFRILPSRNLAYCRYEGVIDAATAEQVFGEYESHPDHLPGQLQLVDLTHITGWEVEFVQAMKLQARRIPAVLKNGGETLLVYIAPTPLARKVAATALRSWAGMKGAVAMAMESEEQALSVLGQPEASLAELFAATEDEAGRRRRAPNPQGQYA